MQKFHDKWGNRRILDLQIMTEKEAEEYCIKQKSSNALKSKLIKRIKQKAVNGEVCEWILSIKNKNNKVVGKIEVFDMGNRKAFFSISIPYNSWVQKYGIEAIDQFVKICMEQKCFDTIELEYNNSIIDGFIRKYSSVYSFSEKYIVKIA